MGRRRRSYRKNSNDLLGTFVNNALAESSKRATKERREREAAARREKTAKKREAARAAKDAERERNRRNREAERQRKAEERERERQARALERELEREAKALERQRVKEEKEAAKLREKTEKVFGRVLLDLEKAGFYPGEKTAADIAKKAVAGGITPAQASKYFVTGKEAQIGASCATELLNSKLDVEQRFTESLAYANLFEYVAAFRPQPDAMASEEYESLKATLDAEILQQIESEERADERAALIQELMDSKQMFRDELEEFAELIEENDFSSSDAIKSPQYQKFIENKASYWQTISSQLQPFDLPSLTTAEPSGENTTDA